MAREFILEVPGGADPLPDDLPDAFPQVRSRDPFALVRTLRPGTQYRFLQACALLENELADLRRGVRPERATVVLRVVGELRAAADQLET